LRLHERISLRDAFETAATGDAGDAIDKRLNAWCESAAGGNGDAFARRLSWEGLSPRRARDILVDSAPLSCLDPVPEWALGIEDLSTFLRQDSRDTHSGLDLVVTWAHRRLRRALAGHRHAAHRLSVGAWAGLRSSLGRSLAAIRGPITAQRTGGEATLGARLLLAANVAPPRPEGRHDLPTPDANDEYTRLSEHPACARATVQTVDLWVSASVRFLVALEEDRQAIASLIGCDTTSVEAVEPAGDPHNGMRQVEIVTFGCGRRIVYKPRSLSSDIIFRRIIGGGAASEPLLALDHPRVLDRHTHGWMEYVSNTPCASPEEIGDFYHRAGVLLFWLYLLDGADCHFENVIASRATPVAIDLELLFSPGMPFGLAADRPRPAEVLAADLLQDSVLRTGLLPKWRYDARKGTSYDISGLANTYGMPAPGNSRAGAQRDHVVYGRNRPHFAGEFGRPAIHVDRLIQGFAAAFRNVQTARGRSYEALEGFTGALARYVFRDTSTYASLLAACDRTDARTNGVDRGIALEALAQPFMLDRHRPEDWSVFLSEVAALEDGDIPYFQIACDGRSLCDAAGVLVEDFATEPSLTRVRRRIRDLSGSDLRRQTTIIRSAFAISAIDAPHSDTVLQMPSRRMNGDTDFLGLAKRIADDLHANAIFGADGSTSWIGPMSFPQTDRVEYQVVGASLYDGVCGIAVFLAALHRVTGKTVYRDRARASLASLVAVLGSGDEPLKGAWAGRMGLGGAAGIGSVIYGLAVCADLLGDDDCLAMARSAVSLVDPGWIEADGRLDLMSGSAGLIHALLGSGGVETGTAGLDLALAGARRLMHMQDKAGGWPTIGPRPILGMSHGSAGIALALDRLGSHCGDPAMTRAAFRGYAFESARYDPARGNWPDLRPTLGAVIEERPDLVAWCHGATGIAVSRLAALRLDAGRAVLLDDAVRALDATARIGQTEVDTLCCGNAGRAYALMVAGLQLNDPSWTKIGTDLMRSVGDRFARRGHFGMFMGISDRVSSPGLFRGTTGIGYTFLRLLEPDLPNVLALDVVYQSGCRRTAER